MWNFCEADMGISLIPDFFFYVLHCFIFLQHASEMFCYTFEFVFEYDLSAL